MPCPTCDRTVAELKSTEHRGWHRFVRHCDECGLDFTVHVVRVTIQGRELVVVRLLPASSGTDPSTPVGSTTPKVQS
jgi:hypothetical protein